MVSEERYQIRVKFSKTGSLKFISHLDLARTMKAAFLRSKLPIWYTMGFNPHPKIVFSVPLSVGTASMCEFMDFMVTEKISEESIVEGLNRAFPGDLRAIEAYTPESRFCDIGWAEYEIRIDSPECREEHAKIITDAFKGDVIVEKTTKIGTSEFNLNGFCDILSCTFSDGSLTVRALLSCGEKTFVNPKHVIDHITKTIPGILDNGDYSVCRTEVYLADKTTKFR